MAIRDDLLCRRNFLAHTGTGLGAIALTHLLQSGADCGEGSVVFDPTDPFAPRQGHYRGGAENVIVVFCPGALSPVDFWEHKPELVRFHGKPLPGNERLSSFQGENGALQQPLWKFRRRGACG